MSVSQQKTDPKKDNTNTVKDPDNWVSGADPMTGAQASYLETLSEQAHQDPPDESISKAEASKLIGELKDDLHLQSGKGR